MVDEGKDYTALCHIPDVADLGIYLRKGISFIGLQHLFVV